ncbi:MAG: hypothetical protein JEY94_00125 [Melioribacteraceae bacterium]|nr:hypothetical protein [Melioribacteraceae bacterium]
MKKTFIILILFSCVNKGQVDSSSSFIDVINFIIENHSSDNNEQQLFDMLEDLYENPIDINNCKIEELKNLPFADDDFANKLFDNKPYKNIVEIISKTNITMQEFITIKYFIRIKSSEYVLENPQTNFTVSVRNRIQNQLSNPNGFDDKYLGTKPKLYSRLKFRYNDYSVTALSEKDSGEKQYTDFTSFSVERKNLSLFDQIIVGDYLVKFGQGLAIWSPYSFSKGIEAVNTVNRKSSPLKQYTSSDENKFMRGISAKLSFQNFSLSGFYSQKNIDASLDEISNEIISLRYDGFHRTESELEKQDVVEEKIIGVTANYTLLEKHSIGVLYYNSKFSNSFKFVNNNELHGKNFNFYSLSYSTNFNRMFIAGEASSNSESIASIINVTLKLTNNFWLVSSYRNYPKEYFNLYSSGFGEQSGNTQNETGFYTGLKWRFEFGILNLYFDQFKFPSSTFGNLFPRNGNETLLNIALKPIRNMQLNIKYKNEIKSYDVSENQKQNYRLELVYTTSNKLRMKSRLEFADLEFSNNQKAESGFLAYHDIRYKYSDIFAINTRFVIFDTDSYESRLYEYESDLAGVMSNSGLFGKGYKWYLLLNYTFFDFLHLSVKYSELYKPFEKSLSSGNSEINSNKDNRLSLQIDIKL